MKRKFGILGCLTSIPMLLFVGIVVTVGYFVVKGGTWILNNPQAIHDWFNTMINGVQ